MKSNLRQPPESAEENRPVGDPCRALLAGVLERSHRDLFPEASGEIRKEAIAWFLDDAETPDQNSSTFSFKQIANELNLSAGEVSLLLKRVQEAIHLQEGTYPGYAWDDIPRRKRRIR